MTNYVRLGDLAQELGIHRSNLLKKCKREMVKTILAPSMCGTGPQVVRWVPKEYAERLRAYYAQAVANTSTQLKGQRNDSD